MKKDFKFGDVFGPGIREQIKEAKVDNYKELSIEKLEQCLNVIIAEQDKKKSFVARTDKRGAIEYLCTWYKNAMVWSDTPKDKWEEKIKKLVAIDSEDMKEGIYRIDHFGLHYEGSSE